MTDFIYRGFWTALDWIYPPVCAGCGEPGYRLCLNCQSKIQFINGNQCMICGESIRARKLLCVNCRNDPPSFTAMRSLAKYDGIIRDCLHALKYENNQSLGEMFAGWLADLVNHEAWSIDLVMPVPLSPQRIAERGYNQSALIAKPLAVRLNIPYHPFGIKRTRDTSTQVGLSAEARHRNVAGAFKAIPEIVSEKSVLLVDDVMTTGSTIDACVRALKNAGTNKVYCLTVARFSIRISSSNLKGHPV